MSLSKFESMLKTDNVYFFDATEFADIIQHYLNIGKHSLANKAVELGLEQHPDSVDLKLMKVELLVFENLLEEAVALLSAIEAVEPNNEEVFIQKATILSKERKHQGAIKFLKQSLEYIDDPVDVWAMIGMEYMYLDDYDNALSYFAKCIDVDYEDYSSLYNIVYCFEIKEDYKGCVRFLNAYLEDNPYSEIAWHQLGRQYFELKMYKEALTSFDYAVLIDEGFIGGYLEKAKTLEELNKHEEAIGNYLITLELDDPTAYVYIRIGECHEKLELFDAAIKYYKKAAYEDPLLDRAWLLLSEASKKINDNHKALYYINKALQIDDGNTLYWKVYADINIKLDFYDDAIKAFYKCLDLGGDTIDVYIALADVLLFIGDYNEALKLLIKVKKDYKDCAEIEYRLCGLFMLLDKKDYSLLHLKTALTLDFEYHHVIKDLFPLVFDTEEVKSLIKDFKKVFK